MGGVENSDDSSQSAFSHKNTAGEHDSTDGTISAAQPGLLGDRTNYDNVTLTSGGTYDSADSDVINRLYSYTSETSDIPGVKVQSGGSLSLVHSKVTKSGDTENRENSGFYGFNAGVLASSSSEDYQYSATGAATTIAMKDCTITTDASGANGAFAFGEDAVITLDHVTIVTTGSDNARGVDATYGGTVNIMNSIISTQGNSSAALATDRYERYESPKINAYNCRGTTAGAGSPGIYCTGTFNILDSTLTATGSEAAVVEGLNSITMKNTHISGTEKWGVMIYQSMSGDSSIGTGSFSMTGGSLTNNSTGPMFFICNTTAVIELTGAVLKNNSDTLLWASNAAAGSAVNSNVRPDWGKNGGTVTFTATDQILKGAIDLEEDSSSIDLTLVRSNYTGAINSENVGAASLTLNAGSSWKVTGDSYLNSLTNNGGTITGTGTIYVNGEVYNP
jgi:hypothetical protein